MPGPLAEVDRRRSRRKANAALAAAALAAAALSTACAGVSAPSPCAGSTRPIVVAAENFWGSIASQLAGERACVASVIANPDTDPHAYEPSPADARLVASARYFIENGVGYDPWASKLVAANPVANRIVLDAGRLTGRAEGDNPHLWYSPAFVDQMIDRIASDLTRVDPSGAAYFDQLRTAYKTAVLREYAATIDAIRTTYAGTPIGATESIVSYYAEATRLNLVTPAEFLRAISEGTEPAPADRAEVQRQIASGSIRVFIFNRQNSTRDVTALVSQARAKRIPVVTVTETLAPSGTTFQDWQTRQLKDLLAALGG